MRSLHVLLIEDDPDHAELIQHALRGQPLVDTIEHVSDGVEGVLYLKGESDYTARTMPDVVLLDLKLPRKDGLQVLREIKQDDDLVGIPVVVLTTSDAEADILEAYRNHANSYLVKPVDYPRFEAMIEELSRYWGRLNRRPGPELTDST